MLRETPTICTTKQSTTTKVAVKSFHFTWACEVHSLGMSIAQYSLLAQAKQLLFILLNTSPPIYLSLHLLFVSPPSLSPYFSLSIPHPFYYYNKLFQLSHRPQKRKRLQHCHSKDHLTEGTYCKRNTQSLGQPHKEWETNTPLVHLSQPLKTTFQGEQYIMWKKEKRDSYCES